VESHGIENEIDATVPEQLSYTQRQLLERVGLKRRFSAVVFAYVFYQLFTTSLLLGDETTQRSFLVCATLSAVLVLVWVGRERLPPPLDRPLELYKLSIDVILVIAAVVWLLGEPVALEQWQRTGLAVLVVFLLVRNATEFTVAGLLARRVDEDAAGVYCGVLGYLFGLLFGVSTAVVGVELQLLWTITAFAVVALVAQLLVSAGMVADFLSWLNRLVSAGSGR